jgi:uncharacterized membrane protein
MARLENEKQISQELKDQNNLLKEQERLKDKSKILSDSISSSIKEQLSLRFKENKLASNIATDAAKQLTFIKSRVSAQGKLSKTYEDQLSTINHIRSSQASNESLSKIIAESAKKEADARAKGHTNVADSQKNLGKMAESQMKLQKSEQIREKVMGKLDGLTGGMASKAKDFGKGMKSAPMHTLKMGAAGLGAILVGVVLKAVTGFSKKIDQVGESFGFMTNKNKEFRNDLIDSGNEAMMIGKNLGDVLAVTSQLSSEFGITLKESQDIAGTVLDTAVATGISNDEATKLFGTFMKIGGLTSDQAENLIESTAQLAAQKGVAPKAVLQDMAGSAEEIAGFTKDGGKNIAEAAVQARQMGLSLSTTAKISEGLLDFESSIANEVEASVMIGKQLNFQKARQLALEGDIAGATKNIVDQVGSEAEFNALNVLQRQSLAKSIGVSVSEMTKLVKGSEKLTLSGALAGKNFDDLVGQDALSGLTSIINSLKMVGASIMDEIGKPMADMLKRFQESVMTPEGMRKFKNDVIGFVNGLISLFNGLLRLADIATFGLTRLGKGSGIMDAKMGYIEPVNDFSSGPGQITHMMGPAGMFSLNPRDSVMGTTNRVNDFQTGPAGSMGGMDAVAFGKAVAANIHLETKTTHGEQRIIMNSAINPYGGQSMNPGK